MNLMMMAGWLLYSAGLVSSHSDCSQQRWCTRLCRKDCVWST